MFFTCWRRCWSLPCSLLWAWWMTGSSRADKHSRPTNPAGLGPDSDWTGLKSPLTGSSVNTPTAPRHTHTNTQAWSEYTHTRHPDKHNTVNKKWKHNCLLSHMHDLSLSDSISSGGEWNPPKTRLSLHLSVGKWWCPTPAGAQIPLRGPDRDLKVGHSSSGWRWY